jgi:hypothetical protein
VESVAAFPWNGWPLCYGISGSNGVEYATYGPVRLEAACRRALEFANPRYRTVKTILAKGLEQLPLTEPLFDALTATYTGQGRFYRDVGALLSH